MKVDKAVCTTNDGYFSSLQNSNSHNNDLTSIIKFETVFTTLVENKILAIKRECEQHESRKRTRTIKNLLFGKSASPAAVEENGAKKAAKKPLFGKNKNGKEVDVEKGEPIVQVEIKDEPSDTQPSNDDALTLDSQINNKISTDCPNIDKLSDKCDNSTHSNLSDKAQIQIRSNAINNNPSPAKPDTDESLATTIDITLQQSSHFNW